MIQTITAFKGKYRFLSNFWPSPINIGSYVYPTVEHAYQSVKALSVSDIELFRKILDAETPGETKKLAKGIKLSDSWHQAKWGYMYAFVFEKFNQNSDLAAMLKATGNAELIEGNTWGDTYWGICRGIGENNLGKILMQVRSCL